MGDKTPEEAFTGQKPHVYHLRIFECITFSQVPKDLRTKLEPTAERGLMVGYSETSKAYHIYIPSMKDVFVHKDV